MYRFLSPILHYRKLFLALVILFLVGIATNFVIAGVVLVLYLIHPRFKFKNQFILLSLLGACFLATNLTPAFSFAENFRYVVLAIGSVYLFYNRGVPRNPGNYILPFAFYATFITFLLSPLGFEAILRGIGYWLIAIVIFVAYSNSYRTNTVITSQLLLGFLLLFFAINCLYLFLGSESYFLGRFRGLTGNPNELGLIAVFSYGIIDFLKKKGQTDFPKNYFLLIKILLVVIILLTGSRTGLFGLVLYELTYRLFQNKFVLFLSILALGILYYLSLTIDPLDLVRSLGLSEILRADSLTTASGRTEVWEVAWEEIKKSPLFGKGMLYDNYFILEYGREQIGDGRARNWYGVWNSYLSLLLDVGILGLSLYFVFVLKMFRISQYKNLAAAFLAMTLFAGITESWMAASMNAFTPLFLLYWAMQSTTAK